MQLSAPRFDVALYTNDIEPMLAFWQGELGAKFDRLLSMGPSGGTQHRHLLSGCTLKINHYEEPLDEEPLSGYRELLVPRDGLTQPLKLTDPDGNRVALVPSGWFGITELGVRLEANDPAAHRQFYTKVLGFVPVEGGYRLGNCGIVMGKAEAPVVEAPMKAKGYRYLTLGVVDIYKAHADALAAGAEEGAAVRVVGETVRYSQLRDPDGSWLELSQR